MEAYDVSHNYLLPKSDAGKALAETGLMDDQAIRSLEIKAIEEELQFLLILIG